MGTLTQGLKTKESTLREDVVIESSKSEIGPSFTADQIHTPTPVLSGEAFPHATPSWFDCREDTINTGPLQFPLYYV